MRATFLTQIWAKFQRQLSNVDSNQWHHLSNIPEEDRPTFNTLCLISVYIMIFKIYVLVQTSKFTFTNGFTFYIANIHSLLLNKLPLEHNFFCCLKCSYGFNWDFLSPKSADFLLWNQPKMVIQFVAGKFHCSLPKIISIVLNINLCIIEMNEMNEIWKKKMIDIS